MTTEQKSVRPKSEAEELELIDEIVATAKRFTVEWLATLGFSKRPIIADDADYETKLGLAREANRHTLASILGEDYRASHGERLRSAHDGVDRETAREILGRLSLHDSTYVYARRLRAQRLEREEAEARQAARLSNSIETMLVDYRREQKAVMHAELRDAITSLVEGDSNQIPAVADLANKLGMSDAAVKNLVAAAEERRGL